MRVGKTALQNNNHSPGLSLLSTDLATVTGEGGSETKEARQTGGGNTMQSACKRNVFCAQKVTGVRGNAVSES
jgi:hypothetical protein